MFQIRVESVKDIRLQAFNCLKDQWLYLLHSRVSHFGIVLLNLFRLKGKQPIEIEKSVAPPRDCHDNRFDREMMERREGRKE